MWYGPDYWRRARRPGRSQWLAGPGYEPEHRRWGPTDYADEYGLRRPWGYGEEFGRRPDGYGSARPHPAEPRPGSLDYAWEYGRRRAGFGDRPARRYDGGRRARQGELERYGYRLPGKPARGYPVRGIHTYDLDYGMRTGGPAEYSGRAGYPTGPAPFERGPYTPWLEPERPARPAYEPWHWSAREPVRRRRRGGGRNQ